MQAGDIITRLNNEPVVVYRDITLYRLLHPTETVTVEYIRPSEDGKSGEKRTAVITPRYSEESGSYMLGIVVSGYYRQARGLGETLKYGAYEGVYCIKTALKSLAMMFRGQVGMDDMAGPVRMVSIIDDTVKETIPYGLKTMILTLMNLCVLLSANLGVMNLLPIPALDGGRIFFLAVDALSLGLFKRKVPEKYQAAMNAACFILLMGVMLLVTLKDVGQLFMRGGS